MTRSTLDVRAAVWRKSSYSNTDGGACVEAAGGFVVRDASWRKSSYSNEDGGACVEVADGFAGVVPVRDSKDTARGFLLAPVTSWSSLTDAIKGV